MVANRSPFFSKEEDLLTESCRTLPNQERQNTTIDNTSRFSDVNIFPITPVVDSITHCTAQD